MSIILIRSDAPRIHSIPSISESISYIWTILVNHTVNLFIRLHYKVYHISIRGTLHAKKAINLMRSEMRRGQSPSIWVKDLWHMDRWMPAEHRRLSWFFSSMSGLRRRLHKWIIISYLYYFISRLRLDYRTLIIQNGKIIWLVVLAHRLDIWNISWNIAHTAIVTSSNS